MIKSKQDKMDSKKLNTNNLWLERLIKIILSIIPTNFYNLDLVTWWGM